MSPGWEIVLWIVAGFLVVLGFAGAVLPGLPGPPLVLAGIVLVAWTDGFQRITPTTLVLMGVVTLLSVVVDFAATVLGVKRLGGSRAGLIGAAIGLVVGLFLGPLGILGGGLLGAIAGELIAGRPRDEAARAGLGAFVGFLCGVVVKLVICVGLVLAAAVAWWA